MKIWWTLGGEAEESPSPMGKRIENKNPVLM
jgi:hypothetical protein